MQGRAVPNSTVNCQIYFEAREELPTTKANLRGNIGNLERNNTSSLFHFTIKPTINILSVKSQFQGRNNKFYSQTNLVVFNLYCSSQEV